MASTMAGDRRDSDATRDPQRVDDRALPGERRTCVARRVGALSAERAGEERAHVREGRVGRLGRRRSDDEDRRPCRRERQVRREHRSARTRAPRRRRSRRRAWRERRGARTGAARAAGAKTDAGLAIVEREDPRQLERVGRNRRRLGGPRDRPRRRRPAPRRDARSRGRGPPGTRARSTASESNDSGIACPRSKARTIARTRRCSASLSPTAVNAASPLRGRRRTRRAWTRRCRAAASA